MIQTDPHPDDPTKAPQGFRDALAELVQMGLRVARMVTQVADAETAMAEAASQAGAAAEGASAMPTSLAEAMEADRALVAAAEARHSVVARAEAVAAAFALVSRAIRLTVLLAERLDRGWAQGGEPDDRQTMARRQIARGVADAIAAEAEGKRAAQLTEALTERLEALDTEAGIGDRPTEEIIAEICRYLGLDPVRMTVRPPLPGAISAVEAGEMAPRPGRGFGRRVRRGTGRTGEGDAIRHLRLPSSARFARGARHGPATSVAARRLLPQI
jgi:hypothetical protein